MTALAQALLDAAARSEKSVKTGVPFLIVHHAEKVVKQEQKKEVSHDAK